MKAYRIGIDVGGTKIAYGLFDEDNNLIDRLREATDPSIDGPSLADQILRQIRTVLQRNALEEKDLKGIGVCMPSFILFDEVFNQNFPLLKTDNIILVRAHKETRRYNNGEESYVVEEVSSVGD